ncbi:DUF192 domain-containing protein [Pseudoduganella umbonata]|uniref:DUF192 domain-containing protein n=1 Tax=Pseudoduganella umbonata TaxID=864828 RepID=A0A4V1EEA5_9BURK|nr:DUF192 domain-containing protein [Pseudoduganella umbonata]MBB3223165.1 hypothetical protein [Pseudoduganella umbonata]QCP13901.1 DUF192 domain-containing protein [Pseudoduganella umbonata]
MKTVPALVALAILCAATGAATGNERFGTTTLTAGMHLVKAEVAATDAQRAQGLMFREAMRANAGMVFVFDAPATQCMWMKNTPLPLSVAFIDAEGKIVNIRDMQPHTLDSHCSTKGVPVKYALEMNLGWFQQKHIKPGMKIGNLPARK